MNKEETILSGLRALCALFNREPSETLIGAYMLGLSDLEAASLRGAFGRAITECKFFPVPELREMCGVSKPEDDAILAWGAVRRAIDQHDYTTSVDFGSHVNAVVRNLGGWLRLCDIRREELDVWARKEFCRVYLAFVNKDPSTLRGEALQGAFGGRPVIIAIEGQTQHRVLPAVKGDISDAIRQLAEAKSNG